MAVSILWTVHNLSPLCIVPLHLTFFLDASCDELKHPNQSRSTCWADEEVVALYFFILCCCFSLFLFFDLSLTCFLKFV